jgi:hypothetical protein
MSRGGYITIIVFLIGVMLYQNFSNEKMIDRYISFVEKDGSSKVSAEKQDTINAEISSVMDSIRDLGKIVSSIPKTSDTIIKKTYVKNIYVLPSVEKENKVSESDIDETESINLSNSE